MDISESSRQLRLARFGEILDAAQREPVTIQRQDRPVAVLVFTEDYERLCKVKVEEFNRFSDEVAAKARARGMTEEIMNELLADES